MKPAFLFLLLFVTLFSCTKKDFCLQPGAVVVRCGFYSEIDKNNPIDTLIDNVSIFTTDTTYNYYNNDTNIGKVNYFIQSQLSQQMLVVQFDNLELTDTIWTNYTPNLKFISNGCGYQYEYVLDSAWSSTRVIQEVTITNANVNSQSTEEHLEIIIQ